MSPSETKNRKGKQMNTTAPKIGQYIVVYGKEMIIVRVLSAGTIEVKSPEGKFFRVTGLSFS
jgi:hypothetical protein